jgi:23S rRNA pseudouridine1911/1915/1917 synthase
MLAPSIQRTLLPSHLKPQRRTLLSLASGDPVSTWQIRRHKPASSSPSSNRQLNTRPPRKTQSNHSNAGKQSRPPRSSNSGQPNLLEPKIVFSNNHLLFVNKPAGYHSQPNESIEQKPSKKCLLSKLKASGLGGGSAKKFLLPMHRLDQPCTGISMLAKNSKAGTRTGNAFRKHAIEKDYFCVVEGNIEDMKMRSLPVSKKNGGTMHKLTGVLTPSNSRGGGRQQSKGGKSVLFKPLKDGTNTGDKRVCHLEWELLKSVSGDVHLIRVITGTGAKHQVRAMMSQLANSPLCGDLRYGASAPLKDQSVALHARSLHLPTVSLGDMDLKKMRFVAPIPKTWSQFFSLTEWKMPTIDYD